MNPQMQRPGAARRARVGRRGFAALEFALMAPTLFLMGLAIVDLGTAIQQRLVLQQAARAAGQYAMLFPTQSAGITAAAAKALPGWTDVTVNSAVCFCAQNGQPEGCGTVCAAGTGSYVIITLQRPYAPLVFNVGNCTNVTGNCASHVIRFQ